ncbi:hypothetical protein BJ508DRAFT_313047 [Ascobolus immersus RN42]|uniref:Uncharacterized protein n=1 Tax=Ascobolus immersus RN42 TaxID=1160509 RepID=A0A3N4HMT4_ASCIM|nr:hypothetical protein BJ508DRAFT_313047 [Ascobolus immersus RN42]
MSVPPTLLELNLSQFHADHVPCQLLFESRYPQNHGWLRKYLLDTRAHLAYSTFDAVDRTNSEVKRARVEASISASVASLYLQGIDVGFARQFEDLWVELQSQNVGIGEEAFTRWSQTVDQNLRALVGGEVGGAVTAGIFLRNLQLYDLQAAGGLQPFKLKHTDALNELLANWNVRSSIPLAQHHGARKGVEETARKWLSRGEVAKWQSTAFEFCQGLLKAATLLGEYDGVTLRRIQTESDVIEADLLLQVLYRACKAPIDDGSRCPSQRVLRAFVAILIKLELHNTAEKVLSVEVDTLSMQAGSRDVFTMMAVENRPSDNALATQADQELAGLGDRWKAGYFTERRQTLWEESLCLTLFDWFLVQYGYYFQARARVTH